MPRQGPPADRRHRRHARRPQRSQSTPSGSRDRVVDAAAGPGARGVRDAAGRGGEPVNLDAAPRAAARAACETLYGEELPEIEVPRRRRGGADRLRARAAGADHDWRRAAGRGRCRSCSRRTCCPAGSGSTSGATGAARRAGADGTTPLLLDADGTVLEAAWAAVLIRRDGRALHAARGRADPAEHLAARGEPGRPAAAARRRAAAQLVSGGTRAGRARGHQPGTAAPVGVVLRPELRLSVGSS